MKLLIVANNLSQGGIQTSLLNLLKVISKNQKYEIDLFLFSNKSNLVKEIPKNVKIIKGNYFLNLTAQSFREVIKTRNPISIVIRVLLMMLVRIIKPKKYFSLFFTLNKNLKEYDYAISYFNDIPATYFNKGATYYVLNYTRAKKKVGWIHTDIEKAQLDVKYFKNEYSDFDYIINVSRHCKDVYDRLIPEQQEKSFVIYNFFPIKDIQRKSLQEQGTIKKQDCKINFITVARIDNISKRIDKIVNIVEKLLNKNIKNFKWYILGNGPDYNMIKEQVILRKLENHIILLGNIENPYPYIKAADMLVLTSDFEGFPMVIGESLCIGTPILTTNYDSVEEQIINGYNGIVVNKDEEALLRKIEEIINDKTIITSLEKNIQKKKLSNDIAQKQFDEIFGEIDE